MSLLVISIITCLATSDVFGQGTGGGTTIGKNMIPPRVHSMTVLDPIPIEGVKAYSVLTIECSFSGNPLPKVEWSLEDEIFVPGKMRGNREAAEGETPRHEIIGNSLVIRDVNGKLDSGRYRCIATNELGSVFMQRNITIRVLGDFTAGNRQKDPAKVLYPTLNKSFKINCPPHSSGYGTEIRWGKLNTKNQKMEYYRAGQIIDEAFPTSDGGFQYAFVTQAHIKNMRDLGGLRCVLYNYGKWRASNPQIFYQAYDSRPENRKAEIVTYMPAQMTAPVDTEYEMVCGATGKPLPVVTWEYQGVKLVPIEPGSQTLNFEFFELMKNGLELRIRRVTQYSGGTFKCWARNERAEDFKEGQLTVYFPPKWLVQFPDTIPLSVSHKLTLECKASGIPEPKYEWYQNGTLITNSTHKKVGGGFLMIEESQFSDHGIYICLAINVLETLTMSTLIEVKAEKPRFPVPLDDPTYIFRESVTYIECPVLGGPIPTREWRKDNVLLSAEKDSRLTIFPKNGTLVIKGVKKSDEGKYKCTATNELGTDSSEMTVMVLEPVKITHPPLKRSYTEGWGYAELFCGASWDERLDLRIEWYKGGVRMTKFDDRIYLEQRARGPPRILFINDLTIYDAGNYSCHAFTEVGPRISEQRHTAELIVKAAPLPPTGVRVLNKQSCATLNVVDLKWRLGAKIGVEAREFYIEFSTNKSSHAGKWFGGKAKPGENRKSIVADGAKRTSFGFGKDEGLPPGANLIFRVIPAYEVEGLMGEPSKPSEVGDCITPPSEPVMNPQNVTGIVPGPGKLTITWLPIMDVYYGAEDFKLELGYRKAGSKVYVKREITDMNITSFVVPSPGINQEFEFYVQSKNKLGDGPAPKIVKMLSGREKPTIAPSNFRIRDNARFAVGFSWDDNAKKEASGYRVKYWNITDAEDLRGRSKRKRRAAGDPLVYQYYHFYGDEHHTGGSIGNISSQLTFLATVQAMNNGGFGPESNMIRFMTQARAPSKPHNVKLQVYGESVHISWNPPLEPNGYIEQYDISWRESGEDGKPNAGAAFSGKVSKDRRSREAYLIKKFEPMKYYDLIISARNRVGPGFDWDRILMAVSAEDVPGKPGAPKADPFDDSAINITFQRPTYGGLPTKFFVYVRPKGEYFKEPKIYAQAFPKRAWALITDLEFVVYDFWTVGINELGQSETSDVTESRPIRRPKPQAHASEYPWWRSNWFVAIGICALFVLIICIVVVMLLRKGPVTYQRFENKPEYGEPSRSAPVPGATKMKTFETKPAAAAAYTTDVPAPSYNGAANQTLESDSYHDRQSGSSRDRDDPPPRYPSQSSIEKKEPLSDDDRSYTGSESGSYTGSESESGSEYSDEDGSYYSDEEKKRSDDEEEEEEEDFSTFV